MSVHAPIARLLDSVAAPADPQRRAALEEIADFLRTVDDPKLLFVCTHNSRRSVLAQAWAQAAGAHFGVGLQAFSGGTEVTAVAPGTVAALREAGFDIGPAGDGSNPPWRVRFADDRPSLELRSTLIADAPNPTSGFAAVLTCAAADAACPVVAGALRRVALPFDDPKAADGTDRAPAVYAAVCRRIGAELGWAVGRAAG